MIVNWEENLRDEIMKCIFDWFITEDWIGCPFIYHKMNLSVYIPHGVPSIMNMHKEPNCDILCHKWFEIENCPCYKFSTNEVCSKVKRMLEKRGWIGQGW